MEFSISYSSILEMLQLCHKLKTGDLKEEEIRQLLNHEDYQFELSRYKNKISEAEFISYFLDLPNLDEDHISNGRLKWHHKYYQYLLANLELYDAKEKELPKIFKKSIFQEQINYALKGLPDDIQLPEMRFISTIGLGPSFGYVYGNGMHFDFIQLIKEKSSKDLYSTIAHEVHHVGWNVIFKEMDINTLSLESMFYLYLSGEGLAVKYCNNAEGILSKAIYDGPKNIGLDSFTWKYLNNDFDNTMIQFKETIRRIRQQEIKSLEDLEKHIDEYWRNSLTKDQKLGDIPKLVHYRLYTFGNDLWGIIHDCFGKDVVFETLKNPQNFPEICNKALQSIGRSDLQF